jgi:hypothetical protein
LWTTNCDGLDDWRRRKRYLDGEGNGGKSCLFCFIFLWFLFIWPSSFLSFLSTLLFSYIHLMSCHLVIGEKYPYAEREHLSDSLSLFFCCAS